MDFKNLCSAPRDSFQKLRKTVIFEPEIQYVYFVSSFFPALLPILEILGMLSAI